MMCTYSGVCRIYTPRQSVHLPYPWISVQPLSLLQDVLDWACLRFTWRQRSSELRDALGGRDSASLDMHLETAIEWTQWCTWSRGSSEFGDALGGHDHANLKAVIERVWRYTWRPWSSEFGDALGGRGRVNSEDAVGGRDRSSLEMHSEAVTKRVWRCSYRLWSSGIGGVLEGAQFGEWRDGSWDSIHWFTCNCGNVESGVQHPLRDEKLAGSERQSILGWCCTWCMLYSVVIHEYGMER